MDAKKKIYVFVSAVAVIIILTIAVILYLSFWYEKMPENVIKMTIQGDSMEATLQPGQEVLVDTEYYQTNPLEKVILWLSSLKQPTPNMLKK